MPKFAILSDIHSNAEALSVVLDKCRELNVDNFISLGDIVGYNAQPRECLQLIRELKFVSMVKGNHDYYAYAGDTAVSGFNENARKAVEWTRNQLDAAERSYLVEMPFKKMIPGTGVTVVHATLDTPENWGYIFDGHHAADNFSYQLSQICFCGHSHVPVAFCKKPMISYAERSIDDIPGWISNINNTDNDFNFDEPDQLEVEYLAGHKYLFNIGSIGQPRNKDPRASFAIIDTDKHIVTRFRLPYDIEKVQNLNLEAGLPPRLAERLAYGN